MTIAAVIVCFFLFEFAKNFIYKPARASMLYKQGYVLLENEDFPQSETKFNEAVKYNLQKKWFFKYAHGYKDHKQYLRAEQMFKNILYCFKHDLIAGLEYASMELEDLANYEKTEQILLRDVLDYHVNDMNGILLLGDNYLEWATEKDPSKYPGGPARKAVPGRQSASAGAGRAIASAASASMASLNACPSSGAYAAISLFSVSRETWR